MLKFFVRMKRFEFMFLDAVIVFISYLIAQGFMTNRSARDLIDRRILLTIILAVMVYWLFMYVFRQYNIIIQFISSREFMLTGIGCACGAGGMSILSLLLVNKIMIVKAHLLSGMIIAVFIIASRALLKHVVKQVLLSPKEPLSGKPKRLLIIGAGGAGNMVIRDILNSMYNRYHIIGIIDDDISKHGYTIAGVKVIGTRHDIREIVAQKRIDMILFTISIIDNDDRMNILKICNDTGCAVRALPGINELILTKSIMENFRDIQIEDFLSRDPVSLETSEIYDCISGRCILVTGGGGSIGSELARQIIRYSPSRLIILDIYENNAYDIQTELRSNFKDCEVIIEIASVRDKARLDAIFAKYRPEIVFHAAAHKHVPLMEDCPSEAVKNNIFGTLNVAECADKYDVDKFVMISTDKAVNPTNVMGASKRVCEMIIQAINERSSTDFVAVRFGNVLGSNGSVIPLFKKQIEAGGPVTVTHREITRYFMTIPEAAQLVLQAAVYATGGEIFVLDMGKPVKINDLAKDMIKLAGLELGRDIDIKYIGLRKGEKLYEELLMTEEGLSRTQNKKIFVARPSHYEFSDLKQRLKVLEEAVENDDNSKLRDTLVELVPTYRKRTENKFISEKGAMSV